MRSLRLSAELDEQVRQAAALEGASVSEFLRRAATERAERTLGSDPRERLAYAIGIVKTDLRQARDSGGAFADIAERKHRGRRR
ncbi:MAG: DUF1778 domain-containing protein [Solirubrobacterales bacterium]|nr:DUF1778 domain-containing protein [Solirubrobacterales bacterium]